MRNWKIDFVQQAHIRNARNWLAAVGHAIMEVVSLHRCDCGESYEQWGDRPTPRCPTCEKTCLRVGKRTKYEERKDKGEKTENNLPQETRQSPTPHVFLDPTPGSRMSTPAVSLTTPPQAPALRHEKGTRQDSTFKKAEKRMNLPREPERNVERSPSPTKSGRGLRTLDIPRPG